MLGCSFDRPRFETIFAGKSEMEAKRVLAGERKRMRGSVRFMERER